MLSKKRRLKLDSSVYKELVEKGEQHQTSFFRVLVKKAGGDKEREKEGECQSEKTIFAVIVPKKLDKRAVKRNRTRRLVYTSLQKKLFQIKKGYSAVIFAKRIFHKEKLKEVELEVEKLLKKAGLL